jgi:hypothetical protein
VNQGPACQWHGAVFGCGSCLCLWRDNFALIARQLPVAVQISPSDSDIAGYRLPPCWWLHACLPACLRLRVRPRPQSSAAALGGARHWTGAAAKRIRRRRGRTPRDALGMRRTAEAARSGCRLQVAAAPTLMWVVARWGARHARDRKREPLYATPAVSHGRPPVSHATTSVSVRGSARRPDSGGGRGKIGVRLRRGVGEVAKFRADSGNSGRVGFSAPRFGAFHPGWALRDGTAPAQAGSLPRPLRSVPFPTRLGAIRRSQLPIRVTVRRSRRATNRQTGRAAGVFHARFASVFSFSKKKNQPITSDEMFDTYMKYEI